MQNEMKQRNDLIVKEIKRAKQRYFDEDLTMYAKGKIRTFLSLFLTLLVMMFGFSYTHERYTITGVILTIVGILVLWGIYLTTNPYTRFYLLNIRHMNDRIETFVTDLFHKIKLDWVYDTNNFAKDIRTILKKREILGRYNSSSTQIQPYNAIHGTYNGMTFTAYQFKAEHKTENSETELFNGSLYVTDLQIDPSYYLYIRPYEFTGRMQVTVNGRDITHRFRKKKKLNNRYVPNDFEEKTNNHSLTAQLLTNHIVNYIELLSIRDLPESLRDKPFNAIRTLLTNPDDLLDDLQPIFEKRNAHRIELFVVENNKLLIYFPHRYKNNDRTYPFDMFEKGELDENAFLSDLDEIMERLAIIQQIKSSVVY